MQLVYHVVDMKNNAPALNSSRPQPEMAYNGKFLKVEKSRESLDYSFERVIS